eukprot:Skav236223  [mRNA]  locus=scaffold132:51353:56125:+ [translate_table: standard]
MSLLAKEVEMSHRDRKASRGVHIERVIMFAIFSYSYGLCIGSCDSHGAWQLALRLLGVAWQPNAANVSEALDACHLSRQSAAAAQLALATARQRATEAEKDAVRARFLSAMRTCVSCREWPLVMDLFERLPQVQGGSGCAEALEEAGL